MIVLSGVLVRTDGRSPHVPNYHDSLVRLYTNVIPNHDKNVCRNILIICMCIVFIMIYMIYTVDGVRG